MLCSIGSNLCVRQGLHLYMINFVKRFVTGSYASTHKRALPTPQKGLDVDLLTRDEFGFRQVIVTANDLGKIYGLDSTSGAILWSRVLGLGWAAQIGGQIIPSKLFVVRTIADGGSPEAVLVAQRRASNVWLFVRIRAIKGLIAVSGTCRHSAFPR